MSIKIIKKAPASTPVVPAPAVSAPGTKVEAACKAEQQAKQETSLPKGISITRRDQIRGVWKQFPTLAKVFGTIMQRWRKSSSIRPGASGFWAAYTQPEWATSVEVSVATWKRSVNQLVAYGLIERDWGRHSGIRVLTFLRPTMKALELSDVKATDFGRLGIAQAPTPTLPPIAPLALPSSPQSVDQASEAAAEALAAAKTKGAASLKPGSTAELVHTWITTMKAEHDQKIPVLTVAEKAMLKKFAEVCGPGEAVPLLKKVIANWASFTMAASYAGAYKVPFIPTIPFLVKHRIVALNWGDKFEDTTGYKTYTDAQLIAPTPPPVVQQKPVEKPAKKKMTLAEVLAPPPKL